MRGYYFITDPGLSAAGLKSDCQKAVAAGVSIIQYRNKQAATRTLYDEALCMKTICMGTSTRLIINDRIDIALAVDAHGVHIGLIDSQSKQLFKIDRPSYSGRQTDCLSKYRPSRPAVRFC